MIRPNTGIGIGSLVISGKALLMSGHTTGEVTQVLKRAGAEYVEVWHRIFPAFINLLTC